jgi:hypothetical protein
LADGDENGMENSEEARRTGWMLLGKQRCMSGKIVEPGTDISL